jgi:hypothetical protein
MGSYYNVDAILTDAQVRLRYNIYIHIRSRNKTKLTYQQKVPCTFELSVPNMGYLQSNPGEDVSLSLSSHPSIHPSTNSTSLPLSLQINKGSKLELPLWLAEMLAVSNPSGNSSLATLDLPQALNNRVMNALKADPKTVDLRAQATHFYNIGARMLELFEEEEMVDILTDVSVFFCLFYLAINSLSLSLLQIHSMLINEKKKDF